ncbi:LicD domain containing protein [Pyrenophora tritici-repentis]|nr:LicD domain containing protein [Pyrenophora tritici-repentis]
MRLAISPLLVAVAYLISAPPSTLVSALPIPHNHHHHSRRSTPFRSLRGLTTLVNSFSNAHTYAQHAPNKYFHESTFHSHYDGRFASAEVPALERTWHLRLMLKAYTDTMERIGIQTWIMHGCLLGWWWGGTLMPWDKDLDFLVEEGGIAELGSWWNMTEEEEGRRGDWIRRGRYKDDSRKEDEGTRQKRETWEAQVRKEGKKYLLEVNPNYTNTSTTDIYNFIDARWIDVSNGLYIDITALHIAPTQSPDTSPSSSSPSSPSPSPSTPSTDDTPTQLYTKDTHAYTSTQLFPLRHTTLEGVPIKVPYAYEELLLEEYGDEALTERG